MLLKGLWIGVWSGIVLGFYLKVMEMLTGIKVYTLLLNIDFIPLLGSVSFPEWIEFFFHLIVSIIIGILYVYSLNFFHNTGKKQWLFALILTLPTIFLFFPLSILSIKEVPEIDDFPAFLLWTSGHLIYFFTLPPLYIWLVKHQHNT
ncbi:hypothetical protein [Jeotgalibacillus soli]|uniref:Uncharacterized protein n=1 Tax=Jeotgalibacillus soli TaxID=889306 RepID=A0A0C2V706_9BACL|nr:hypothetical protein [Jeotgalibacillus soli]KIL44747.1 hypothetical protein KP78_22910 [Jeotgalibacillus soli]